MIDDPCKCTGFASTAGPPLLVWSDSGITWAVPHSPAGLRRRPSRSHLPAVRRYHHPFFVQPRQNSLLTYMFLTGSLGFVAINNMDTAWTATFATGLPAGSYCNVIEGPSSGGICSGTAYVTTSRVVFHHSL